MQWTADAIVIATHKYGESDLILTLLTEPTGIYKGLLRGATNKKNRGLCQLGNQIHATWKARLPEHLGNYTGELHIPTSATFLHDPLRLSLLHAACTLVASTLPEQAPHANIYHTMMHLLTALIEDQDWVTFYIWLELFLLSELGFGLDFSSCAATGGTENLHYVSPKSARAVCFAAGEPYKHKLFLLPDFLKNAEKHPENRQDIENALALSGFFLDKYVFAPHGKALPHMRAHFIQLLQHSQYYERYTY